MDAQIAGAQAALASATGEKDGAAVQAIAKVVGSMQAMARQIEQHKALFQQLGNRAAEAVPRTRTGLNRRRGVATRAAGRRPASR